MKRLSLSHTIALNATKTKVLPPYTRFAHTLGLVALGSAFFISSSSSAGANADAPPPPPPLPRQFPPIPPSTPVDALKALQLVQARNAYNLPLDLKVEGATVEDIAARVQKKLASSPVPAIKRLRVEVRNVKPIRLSFDAKGSTIGNVLYSTAFLATARVWTFADYLLIAPEEALTAQERETNKMGLQQNSTESTRFPPEVMKAFTSFISSEIKALVGSGEARPSFADARLTLNTNTFVAGASPDQLSPYAQAMLQALVQSSNDVVFSDSLHRPAPLEVTSSAFIGINSSTSPNGTMRTDLSIEVPRSQIAATYQLRWGIDGTSFGAAATGPASPSPNIKPSRPVPGFIDPSAGKSE